jgi:hypothetical protein
MCELTSLADDDLPRTINVGEMHPHVVNLASVIAHPALSNQLREHVYDLPHDPDVLSQAQKRCRDRESHDLENWFGTVEVLGGPDLPWAIDYFVSVWMSRSGCAGTRTEFNAPQSVRWDAGGGDSATRVRNACDGITAWQRIMRKCTFVRCNVFAFLDKCNDWPENGLYLDPPFPEKGDDYKYVFSISDHRKLAKRLRYFDAAHILCRFYDHSLIRELYPETSWRWEFLKGGKTQTNEAAPEVLISRRLAA